MGKSARSARTASWAASASLILGALVVVGAAACHPPIRSTLDGPPTAAQLAQLWVEPEPNRDLFWGVGGPALAPDPIAIYRVLSVKTDGFSPGYKVADPQAREWSAKFYPESHTEVVASRILWGIGYHQPPIYFLDHWMADGAPRPNPQDGARFRQEQPDFYGLREQGHWPYHQNPFVGTVQLAGLLVLQAMLGNSDLKNLNNTVYSLDAPVEGASRWFVARDLGHTFGRTGVLGAPRDDPKVFDETPFITGVEHGIVKFDWRGRWDELFEQITPRDVRWVCERLAALTDDQWHQAFKAGGYPTAIADRYIARLKQKIAEGLAVKDTP